MKGKLETTQDVKQLTHFDVLLVDDEYYIRQAVKRNLENIDSSFRVKAEASNGKEALDLMKQENFHLVITDIKMPVMDGLALSAKIKDLYPDVAICIVDHQILKFTTLLKLPVRVIVKVLFSSIARSSFVACE